MSNNLNGTSRSQFDTLIWYQFCLHPPCTVEPGTQLLLTYFKLLLGERGEEPFNLIQTASCHLLLWHENKTSPLKSNMHSAHVCWIKDSLGIHVFFFNENKMWINYGMHVANSYTHCWNYLKSFPTFTKDSPDSIFNIPLNIYI